MLSGRTVQITRKIKRVLQKAVVDHTVAERKNWAKFGQEKGSKPGPDRATTTVGENVALKLSAGNKVSRLFLSASDTSPEPTDEEGPSMCELRPPIGRNTTQWYSFNQPMAFRPFCSPLSALAFSFTCPPVFAMDHY